ncbi:aminoglycoside phosphotransferase family protein [Pseudomonas sp. JUb96]|uniref:aminoglycoside phosphotransferase family protein n=1 Tax=Pseudomonas sp. JUb96 TaxID=2940539 RepID=UPI002226E648|nr:aminoglycoside phosphotransferase family protein [Pseudomonas sp. JUb96]MCW2270147.1 streptomycin 6-kinase [Pseudomonas sp. JUb96]
MFEPYLQRWQLIPDGTPLITASSHLLAVVYQGELAMLKVACTREEQHGAEVMTWWNGEGAARVLAHADNGLLLERALGPDSLAKYAEQGRDEQATRILCQTIALLHAPRNRPALPLIELGTWFSSLWSAADAYDGFYRDCAQLAQKLLAAPQEECVLHGDIHHGNVLDFGARGWRAIDPKCLYGERTFDYANLFCNPSPRIATDARLFSQRLATVCRVASLPRQRLLQWIVAWCGLSAAWFLEDGLHEQAAPRLKVAQLALDALKAGN